MKALKELKKKQTILQPLQGSSQWICHPSEFPKSRDYFKEREQ